MVLGKLLVICQRTHQRRDPVALGLLQAQSLLGRDYVIDVAEPGDKKVALFRCPGQLRGIAVFALYREAVRPLHHRAEMGQGFFKRRNCFPGARGRGLCFFRRAGRVTVEPFLFDLVDPCPGGSQPGCPDDGLQFLL